MTVQQYRNRLFTAHIPKIGVLLLTVMLSVLSRSVAAQEITFITKLNRTSVAVNERFSISFVLTNSRASFSPPDFSGLSVIFGPSKSEMTSQINGKYSSTITVSYIVMAEKEGKVTIGRAKAYTDKGVLETDPVTITIEKNQIGANTPGNQAQSSPSPSTQKGDIILSVIPGKSKAYIGEPITVTYYLYSRYERLELGKYDFPAISGFWCEDLKQQSTSWENQLATINGLRYKVAILKRQVIYPQKTGKFTVKPFEMECTVNRSFFSVGSTVKVLSNSPVIEVLPFPSGAPANFQDISGKYKIESSLSSSELKANEPLTLKIKVTGDGNLKVFGTPTISFPSDFEVYDPKINDKHRLSVSGINGSREFEYLVIPRFPGEYEIPSYSLTYFDLSSRTYKTLATPAYKVKVNKGTGQSAGTYAAGNQNQVKLLTKDIRYIHTGDLPLEGLSPYSPKHPIFWLVFSAVPIAFAAMTVVVTRKRKLNKDKIKLKVSGANKLANKHLSEAKKALQLNDSNRFYEATFKALYGYLSDKVTIPYGDLSRRIIENKLLSLGVEPNLVSELLVTLDTCEMARFAQNSQTSPPEVYKQATDLINKLEKSLN